MSHDAARPRQPTRDLAWAMASFTRRYRWPLTALWLLLLGAAGISAASIDSLLSGGGWLSPGSQSQRAAAELASAGLAGRGHTTITVVVHDSHQVAGEPSFEARARQVVDAVAHDPALRVSSRYGWTTLSPASRDQFLGADHRTVVEAIALDLGEGAARRELPRAQKRLAGRFADQGLQVALVGVASFSGAANTSSQEGLGKAELLTLPLVVIILVLLYRGVVAVLVSLTVSITAVVLTLGVLSQVARHYELSNFAETSATMLGLGIGVDYSLFMIARFREELSKGRDVPDAVAESLRTSGHTVVFSGSTVMLTMFALFLVNIRIIASIALGAIVVVGCSMIAATVVLPVLLHLLGHRINGGRRTGRPHHRTDTSSDTGRWHRVASAVMRHPVLIGGLAFAELLALALPVREMQIFTPDARILPQSTSVRQGYDLVQDQFGVGATSPIQVVVHAVTVQVSDGTVLVTLNDQLKALPHVARVRSLVEVLRAVSPQQPLDAMRPGVFDQLPDDVKQSIGYFLAADRRTTLIEVVPDLRASDDATRTLVAQVRDRVSATALHSPQLQAVVGGETAEGVDSNNAIQHRLATVMLVMLALIFLILLVTFRSVFLPLKAVALNTLSVGATYGILVMIFQRGYLTNSLGLNHTGNLQNFVPILLLAVLFSLSTDYEVFLLNRVREHYLRSGDNTAAVASGVQTTGPLISGAAVLMVAVFGAFSFTGMVPIEQLGFGMAVGVAIDATVVRLILVPAAMRLMGRGNWWPTKANNRVITVGMLDDSPVLGQLSTITLSSTPNPSQFGEPVTLVVTVSPGSPHLGMPSGTVTIRRGTTALESGQLDKGRAVFIGAGLVVGTHLITASYHGYDAFLPSTSTPHAHKVICTQTLTGTINEGVVVASGSTCIHRATVNGSVTVKPGAALAVIDSTLYGGLFCTRARAVAIRGSQLYGAISIEGTTGIVTLGSENDADVGPTPANAFYGTLRLTSNPRELNGGLAGGESQPRQIFGSGIST